MMYRNLCAMDVEEIGRANPVDGMVLLVGCDKTTPACLMGACSTDLPTIVVSGGPMLNGRHRGKVIGSGTSMWEMHDQRKRGALSQAEFHAAEGGMSRSTGTCNTMGTASTMACMAESLGISLPGNAAIPAVDSRRKALAHMSGMRIVEMVKENVRPSDILTRESFENAIKVNCAIGGSTNALIHLLAIAGRVKGGCPLTLDDFDTLGRDIPTIVNLMPAGEFLMEEFYYAGGLPVVIRALIEKGHLNADVMTVSGMSLRDNVADAENFDEKVIMSLESPLTKPPHIAVLRGNLAPNGAVIKVSSASKHLLQHSGPACVFQSIDDYKSRIDDEDLDCDENSILVLQNCGLRGYPGMAEVGNMALPAKMLKKGIEDMVRISDARMSGTAFGTCILHVSPEAALGGNINHVRDGDVITLDVNERTVSVDVSEEELEKRKSNWTPPLPPRSGYAKLFHDCIEGPELGADFDFLKGAGAPLCLSTVIDLFGLPEALPGPFDRGDWGLKSTLK
eukprot:CAMPEP_0201910748 /NCGR_PEP_ID=MMETSP0903-20130614/2004_1 /ASSEMBLY_ACC=CAM_ASM_000552 /TAXON_ID=420261 /ORGANISM="Thalassiosira antarctica, Strain CCMP982" /LENGTH=507 /DNA_ID=CAMNT_0048445419 /DNA_START=689 /DNA_END=2213 /DNA_ORIENTATION=-